MQDGVPPGNWRPFAAVIGVAAIIALGFVIGTAAIAVLVHGVEKERAQVVPPE